MNMTNFVPLASLPNRITLEQQSQSSGFSVSVSKNGTEKVRDSFISQ